MKIMMAGPLVLRHFHFGNPQSARTSVDAMLLLLQGDQERPSQQSRHFRPALQQPIMRQKPIKRKLV